MNQILTADELVRETRHRVKNSLQLVMGMLSLQARQSWDEGLVRGLREAISRVATVAHLHEHLQYEDARLVDLADYLRDICNDLTDSPGSTCVRFEADHIEMQGPEALALGLVVNELVTNALKHAYPEGHGPIDVRLTRSGPRVTLSVADHGIGRSQKDDGLGLMFVKLLARKLDGEVAIADVNPGTRVALVLKPSAAVAKEATPL